MLEDVRHRKRSLRNTQRDTNIHRQRPVTSGRRKAHYEILEQGQPLARARGRRIVDERVEVHVISDRQAQDLGRRSSRQSPTKGV